tara:strand:- start:1297 stop:2046 length:750 start_codon:yes stop_codon:yes gene_type:complete
MGYFVVLLFVFVLWIFLKSNAPKKHFCKTEMKEEWKIFLVEHVGFYKRLNDINKYKFNLRVIRFLNETRVIGYGDVQVSDNDKILVGASAIIPIFNFPEWEYKFINEVILYDDYIKLDGSEDFVCGFVGAGPMEGRMVLVKSALYHGFANNKDKKNTGIHEFMHIIDKQDGLIDGVPSVLMDKTDIGLWLEMIRIKSAEISNRKTNINNYALTNRAEFLAVVSEYFFERPELMKTKHPELYQILKETFS